MGQLLSFEIVSLTFLMMGKIMGLKRKQATRAFEFPVGTLTDFRVSVPTNVWEEVLNQALFLLNLQSFILHKIFAIHIVLIIDVSLA